MIQITLFGIIKRLIILVGQRNDQTTIITCNSSNTISSVDPFDQRTSEQPEIFLNSKEVCELLECSRDTLMRLRNSDSISFFKINTAVRFRRTDIINYITKTT